MIYVKQVKLNAETAQLAATLKKNFAELGV